MKLAFVYSKEEQPGWNDGLAAALKILEQGWVVKLIDYKKQLNQVSFIEPDVVLAWGGFNSPPALAVQNMGYKKALAFGGGSPTSPDMHKWDLIFAESKVDLEEMRKAGANVLQAFGTNTDLFKPIPEQPKMFDALYPAAFALWKHHELFVKYVTENNLKALAVGQLQDHEKECYQVCLDAGIMIMPTVTYDVMPWLYNASKEVVLAADQMGGSQRAVLEAIACGIPVRILSDSPKLLELSSLTREQVLEEYSPTRYAQKLNEGMRSLL